MAICKPRRQPSPDTDPTGTLILNFPASRTVTNKFLWLVTRTMIFCYSDQDNTLARKVSGPMTSHPHPLLSGWGDPLCTPKPRKINVMHTLEVTCMVSSTHR